MISEQEACDRVLARFVDTRGAIASCRLDPRGEYWVIHANAYEYVVNGRSEHCLIGDGAYLVHIASGRLTITPSHETWHESIQDIYDLDDAAGAHYVLRPDYAAGDKRAIVHLHQRLGCSLIDARWLLEDANRSWLTGTGRNLRQACELLAAHGVETQRVLQDELRHALLLTPQQWTLDMMLQRLRERASLRSAVVPLRDAIP
ncbi:hypothetical protein GLE_4750 [Lysobacter enzymogenes]|uniref:Uncharacterized protein n=1 Tax=Lysobacter enzymogenes TaxID=69 RepID=A0A0S2DMT0_LYSEN|nr:hypothetical protein [Lysobacter enzymogenes]ALN60091.1 hypothetical protein GLE_4750 [Lysobacter enzymogenes]QCW28101.1 hypothetical protein FE772_23090 [Lysobacter enzymogenes]